MNVRHKCAELEMKIIHLFLCYWRVPQYNEPTVGLMYSQFHRLISTKAILLCFLFFSFKKMHFVAIVCAVCRFYVQFSLVLQLVDFVNLEIVSEYWPFDRMKYRSNIQNVKNGFRKPFKLIDFLFIAISNSAHKCS